MKTATAQIEIAAPNDFVRQKFLRFEDFPRYHTLFFREIEPLSPSKSLEPGNKLRNHLAIGTFEAVIQENSPACFTWAGGNAKVFLGAHSFLFTPSKVTPGGTTFTQKEDFTGAFSFLMGDNFASKAAGIHKKSDLGWQRFNEDFKKWCEEAWAKERESQSVTSPET